MANPVHPASLNAYQRFRQACAVLSDTSRANLPAWYQEALELDHQVHVRLDGTNPVVFFYHRPTDVWSEGTPLSESAFTDPEEATLFGTRLVDHVRSLKGTSVGVVLHIAEEFSTAELKPELDNPASLPDLREAAYESPEEVLDDSSIPHDQASWRVIPYPAAGSEVIATTVSLSRRLEPFLNSLRDLGNACNFPVVTHSLSAPLVVISGLHSVLRRDSGKPAVAILQYPWFTAMAFFNEHLDLRLMRTLQHRGTTGTSNFRHALATTNASLEFEDPDIYIVPLGEEADSRVQDELERGFPDSKVETVRFPLSESVPEWAPEMSLAMEPSPVETENLSHTFGALRGEKWFLQDFLSPAKAMVELFPDGREMRLLRFLKLGRVAVFGLAILAVAWMAFSALSVMRRPEWSLQRG